MLHAPAHFDAEVTSALGRLQRAGALTEADGDAALAELRQAPVVRHDLVPLLAGAWAGRADQLTASTCTGTPLSTAVPDSGSISESSSSALTFTPA